MFFQKLNKVRCGKDTAGGVNQKDWKIRECSAPRLTRTLQKYTSWYRKSSLVMLLAVQSNIPNETKSDVTYYTV